MVAASVVSIYAFEALKAVLKQVDGFHFIFTSRLARKRGCAVNDGP